LVPVLLAWDTWILGVFVGGEIIGVSLLTYVKLARWELHGNIARNLSLWHAEWPYFAHVL